jgi:hypothetical protein
MHPALLGIGAAFWGMDSSVPLECTRACKNWSPDAPQAGLIRRGSLSRALGIYAGMVGQVLNNTATPPVSTAEESEDQLEAAAKDMTEPPSHMAALAQGAQRVVRTLWRLRRTLLDLQNLFDERPRGGLLAGALAKLPVVGLAAGWLDERGAIHKAARQTQRLIAGAVETGR